MRLYRLLTLTVLAASSTVYAGLEGSGDSSIKGDWFFRHVAYRLGPNGLTDEWGITGTISYDGAGKYQVVGKFIHSGQAKAQSYSTSGNYTVSSNWNYQMTAFVNAQLLLGGHDTTFGVVGKTAIIASTTEYSGGDLHQPLSRFPLRVAPMCRGSAACTTSERSIFQPSTRT